MAFERAFTALSTLEEKLRRSLGLAGEIGATFKPELTPVIITGDLREAGNAFFQGRAFAWSHVGPVGLGFNTYQSVQVGVDVFIDTITLTMSAAGTLDAYVTSPGQAPGVAVVANAGTWTDRKTVSTDAVPLTQGVAGARTGIDSLDTNRVCAIISGGASGQALQFRVNLMLPAGACLNFRSGAAGASASFSGRIL